MKYRKKLVVVEATQWFKNGDHPDDYAGEFVGIDGQTYSSELRKQAGWEGSVVRYYRHPQMNSMAKCGHCGNIMHNHGWIDTQEGGRTVCPGDWIITGVAGERYPCKPAIFDATYELAEN